MLTSPLEEYIKLNQDENAQAVPSLHSVKHQRIFRPRTSVYGRTLWPGQRVWTLSYFAICFYSPLFDPPFPMLSGMYTHEFDAYLSESEYIMAKITGDQVAVDYKETWPHLSTDVPGC